NSGGTDEGSRFYNITHAGSGTLQPVTSHLALSGALATTGSGTLDFDTGDRNMTVEGNMTLARGKVIMGAGTWTVGGNFNNSTVTTWTRGNYGTLVLTGTADFTPKLGIGIWNFTIAGGADITYVSAGGSNAYVANILTVNGHLEIQTGRMVYSGETYTDFIVNAGGSVDGAGTLALYRAANGHGLTVLNGTLDCLFWYYRPETTGRLAAGRYGGGLTIWSNLAGKVATLDNGTYTVIGPFAVSTNTTAGQLTLNNATNNPSFDLRGGVTVTDATNPVVWTKGTGTITLSGSTAQSVNLLGKTVEDMTVNKTHGIVTFTGTGTVDSLTVSSGTVNFNGKRITTVGNVTIGTTGQVAPAGLPGTVLTVGGNLSLTGQNGDLLSLSATGAWTLNVAGAGTAQYVTVANSNASGGRQINAAGGTNTDGGGNLNWHFGGDLTGKLYSDEGVTPVAGKTVSVSLNGGAAIASDDTDAGGQYVLESLYMTGGTIVTLYVNDETEDAVTVLLGSGSAMTGVSLYQNRLIVRSESGSAAVDNAILGVASLSASSDTDISAIFSIASGNLTVASGKELMVWTGDTFTPGGQVTASDYDINGTLNAGTNAFTVNGSFDATGGSFSTSGTATFGATAAGKSITSNGGSFGTVTFNGTGGQWTLQDNFTANNVTFNAGALTGGAWTMDVNGNLNMAGGALLAPARINVSGNWTKKAAATFTAGSSVVTLDGTNQVMSGSTTFSTLRKKATSPDILYFAAGDTQAVTSRWSMSGSLGALLSLRSSLTGAQWNINPSGARSIGYLDVKNSTNANATIIEASDGTNVNNGGNTNWRFSLVPPTLNMQYVAPFDNALAAHVIHPLLLRFSEPVTKRPGSITIYKADGTVFQTVDAMSGAVHGSSDSWWVQHAPFSTGTGYYVRISAGAFWDSEQNEFAGIADATAWNFTTTMTVAGTVYQIDGTTPVGPYVPIAWRKNGGVLVDETVTDAQGNYTLTGATMLPGDVITIHLRDSTYTNKSAIVISSAGRDMEDVDLYVGHVIVRTNRTGIPMRSSSLSTGYTNDPYVTGMFQMTGNHMYVPEGQKLLLWNDFQSEGNLVTPFATVRGTFNLGGHLLSASGMTLQAGAAVNAGTGTVTMKGPLTIGAASFAQQDATMRVSGNLTVGTGATFTKASNGSPLILNGDLDLYVVDGGTNLGNLRIGESPDTTNLKSDITVDSLTVGTGDVLHTHGYDVTVLGDFINYGTVTTVTNGGRTTEMRVAGAMTNHGSYTADDSVITLSGAWLNDGTFQANTSTVILDGAGQTVSGTGAFYNLVKGVTAADTLTFQAGATQTVTNRWSMSGSLGNVLSLRSSVTGSQWNINPSGTRVIGTLDVRDSNNTNATAIDARGGTNVNSGNNVNWLFGFNVTGRLFSDEGTTPLANRVVTASVNGGPKAGSGTTDAAGSFTITGVNMTGGTVVALYADGGAEKAVTVVLGSGSAMTGISLYQNRLILRSESGSAAVDNAILGVAVLSASGDADVTSLLSSATPSAVTVSSGYELYLWPGDTFVPGGTVSADDWDVNGTVNMSTNAYTISGSFDATGGTFTTTGTGTFTATSAGKTIMANGNAFRYVTFNGAGGGWTPQDAFTASGITVANGTLAGGAQNVRIDGDVTISGGVFSAPTGSFTVAGNWNKTGG
ncbi:MAG: hypothetical protein AAB728_04115, partial [Patescibacteria group bacterium]